MAKTDSYRAGKKPKMNEPLIDLTGQRFGRLVVIGIGERKAGRIAWECKCDCGNTKNITGQSLKAGLARSCGCLRKEIARKKATKHLLCGTRLYYAYDNMKRRCYDKKSDHYKWYGAEGKGLCPEWSGKDGFQRFADWSLANGYTDELTIDRIDNTKGYSPDNCRWVTPKENCRNKRNNHFITYQGETKTIAEWAEVFGMPDSTLRQRIKAGWSVDDAVTKPIKGRINDGNK